MKRRRHTGNGIDMKRSLYKNLRLKLISITLLVSIGPLILLGNHHLLSVWEIVQGTYRRPDPAPVLFSEQCCRSLPTGTNHHSGNARRNPALRKTQGPREPLPPVLAAQPAGRGIGSGRHRCNRQERKSTGLRRPLQFEGTQLLSATMVRPKCCAGANLSATCLWDSGRCPI